MADKKKINELLKKELGIILKTYGVLSKIIWWNRTRRNLGLTKIIIKTEDLFLSDNTFWKTTQKKISEKDKNLAIDNRTYKTCKAADLKPNAVADITLTKCRSEKVSFLLIIMGRFNDCLLFWMFSSTAGQQINILTLSAAIPQNGQTHSNNLSAICRRIVWVCLTILWNWCLKGKWDYTW